MGWLYETGKTRAALIADLTADSKHTRCLAKAVRGNVLWSVREVIEPWDASTPAGTRIIACSLLGRSNGAWGSKEMDETMGPYYYTCPLKFLDLATAPLNEWARAWREKVRAYHARTLLRRAG